MAIQGMLERQRSASRRGFARMRLNLEVTGKGPAGTTTKVQIHNLSSTGLLMETSAELALGSKLAVALPEAGDVEATVVWKSDTLFGCRFEEPLSRAALGAAQLRNPVPGVHLADTSGERFSGASLPEHLRKLRESRGLSRAALAERAGVSKPTLWAWEVGKSTPRKANLSALAKALGVSDAELISGPSRVSSAANDREPTGDRRLQNVLRSSKKEIAEVAGVATEKVTISIEF